MGNKATKLPKQGDPQKNAEKVFNIFDTNKDGYLSRSELKSMITESSKNPDLCLCLKIDHNKLAELKDMKLKDKRGISLAQFKTLFTQPKSPPHLFKVLIIGHPNVGKTTIANKFGGTFDREYAERFVNFGPNRRDAQLNIYDPLTEDKPREYMPRYSEMHGVVVVFDLTDRNTWENAKNWLKEADRYAYKANRIFVGTRLDLPSRRAVERSQVIAFLTNYQSKYADTSETIDYYEVNALTGENLEEAFFCLAALMMTTLEYGPTEEYQNEKTELLANALEYNPLNWKIFLRNSFIWWVLNKHKGSPSRVLPKEVKIKIFKLYQGQ